LWKRGTQTVFGAGPARAAMVLVGEQPGDEEDKLGQPFVGPAGRLLRASQEAAGILAVKSPSRNSTIRPSICRRN
jgi:DNA polymerase